MQNCPPRLDDSNDLPPELLAARRMLRRIEMLRALSPLRVPTLEGLVVLPTCPAPCKPAYIGMFIPDVLGCMKFL